MWLITPIFHIFFSALIVFNLNILVEDLMTPAVDFAEIEHVMPIFDLLEDQVEKVFDQHFSLTEIKNTTPSILIFNLLYSIDIIICEQ